MLYCRSFTQAYFGFLLSLAALSVNAQTVPDLERIQQQNEQILQQQQQQQAHDLDQIEQQREHTVLQPPARSDQGGAASESTLCFLIDTIEVLGVTRFEARQIESITQDYSGRCLGLDDINGLLKALTTIYIDRGFVTTRAYLPQQNLSSGKLLIQVIEGMIEGFDQWAAEGISVATAFPSGPGELLNLRDIEQGIEQLNRLAANRVRMELVPGSSAGATTIQLINQAQSPWQSNVRYDNSGQDSTGEEQARLYLSRDNLFGLNDFLFLSFQSDLEGNGEGKKSETLALRFEIPYGYWLFSLDLNDFEYANRVEGQSEIFDTTGSSEKQTLTASRVIARDQSSKTEVITALTRKASRNYIEGVKLETSSRNLGIGSVQLRQRHYFPGNQSLQSSLTWRKGLDLFGTPDAVSSSAPQPQYTAWLADISYAKRFTWLNHNWSCSSALSLQYSDDNLFGSEQFGVGGLYSVRGFKEDSLSARAGAYWRNDLSIMFPLGDNSLDIHSLTAFLGLDAGSVSNEPDDPNNHETLEGMAAGFSLGGKHVSADFTFARALKRPQSFSGDAEYLHFSLTLKL